MGGRAFYETLGVESKRLTTENYLNLWNRIEPLLRTVFNKVHLVRSYYTKPTHGDLDCMVSDIITQYDPKKVMDLIGAQHMAKNSNIVSYLINGFQVDLGYVNPEHWETS